TPAAAAVHHELLERLFPLPEPQLPGRAVPEGRRQGGRRRLRAQRPERRRPRPPLPQARARGDHLRTTPAPGRRRPRRPERLRAQRRLPWAALHLPPLRCPRAPPPLARSPGLSRQRNPRSATRTRDRIPDTQRPTVDIRSFGSVS